MHKRAKKVKKEKKDSSERHEQNRVPEELFRDFWALEHHPVIGPPLVDLVSVSMNLVSNVRHYPVAERNRILAHQVSSDIILSQIRKVNSLIRVINKGKPEKKRIREITVEEIFSIIYTRL
ncbi:MAG: hypothetical protein ABIH20_04935 [Candidatus Diapherotrites archaeon]